MAGKAAGVREERARGFYTPRRGQRRVRRGLLTRRRRAAFRAGVSRRSLRAQGGGKDGPTDPRQTARPALPRSARAEPRCPAGLEVGNKRKRRGGGRSLAAGLEEGSRAGRAGRREAREPRRAESFALNYSCFPAFFVLEKRRNVGFPFSSPRPLSFPPPSFPSRSPSPRPPLEGPADPGAGCGGTPPAPLRSPSPRAGLAGRRLVARPGRAGKLRT